MEGQEKALNEKNLTKIILLNLSPYVIFMQNHKFIDLKMLFLLKNGKEIILHFSNSLT